MGRTILVTGCSGGFGRLTALRLARQGHRVFATMRDPTRSTGLQDAAAAEGLSVRVLALDVTDERSRQSAIDTVLTEAGSLDVLVNNAGQALGGFFEEIGLDELRAQFEVNFFGIAALCQAVLPAMRAAGGGRIVNVSSASGFIAQPAVSAYCASKFALEGLSESLRLELASLGVKVVLVEPGSFKTDIFTNNRWVARRTFHPESPYTAHAKRIEKRIDKMAANLPSPDAVAKVIAHAATTRRPALRYVVGHDARFLACVKRWVPFGVWEAGVQWAWQRI